MTRVKPVIAVPAIGLTPRSPVSDVVPVVVMPVFARMTNDEAVPRLTGAGPAPPPDGGGEALAEVVAEAEPLADAAEPAPPAEPPDPPSAVSSPPAEPPEPPPEPPSEPASPEPPP